ncbi:MAG: glycosyltransferase, partial [Candidatus Subteraquimicrobiales bacterium]|nr:glycosyltransferase [Candidatus Subteraquimicrobiales bacterium]
PPAIEEVKAFDLPPNITPGKPVLLFVGRLIREKGIFEILEAITSVNAQIPCHLIMAGDGPCEQQVKQRIAELGLGDCVTLAGYLTGARMSGVYHQANVFVLPTYHIEGFPTVISEAMNVGLPIITTRLRGAADHLIEGVNALFVPPRDPVVLAKTVIELLSNSDLRSRMGLANKEKIKDFAPDVVGRQYLNVLHDVIKRKN